MGDLPRKKLERAQRRTRKEAGLENALPEKMVAQRHTRKEMRAQRRTQKEARAQRRTQKEARAQRRTRKERGRSRKRIT